MPGWSKSAKGSAVMPMRSMTAVERLFCPHCGQATAVLITGEGDYSCENAQCTQFKELISPLYERNLQGQELIRLTLENERLRAVLRETVESLEKMTSSHRMDST